MSEKRNTFIAIKDGDVFNQMLHVGIPTNLSLQVHGGSFKRVNDLILDS